MADLRPKVNIIIDTNLIFYKFAYVNAYKHSNYLSKPSHRTQLVKDITRSIAAAINNYRGYIDRVIFVADSSKQKSWRKDIPVEEEFYKSTRNKDYPFDIVAFKNTLHNYIKLLREIGIYTYQYDRMEGDDLMFIISNILFHNGLSSILMTGDVDMYQLVKRDTDGRFIYLFNLDMDKKFHIVPDEINYVHSDMSDPFNGAFNFGAPENVNTIKYNNIQDICYTDYRIFDPQAVIMGKVLAGDKSDNVPSSYYYMKGVDLKKDKLGTLTSFTEKRANEVFAKYYTIIKTDGTTPEGNIGQAYVKTFPNDDKTEPMTMIDKVRLDSKFRIELANHMIDAVKTKPQIKAQGDAPNDPSVIDKICLNMLRNVKFMYLHHSSYTDDIFTGKEDKKMYQEVKLSIGKDLSNKEFLLTHISMFEDGWKDDLFVGTDIDTQEDEITMDFRSF